MEQYRVTGMTCAACSARVEKAVSAVDGVTMCSVNLLTNSMTVDGSASADSITAAVIKAGYGIGPMQDAAEKEDDAAVKRLRRRLIVSVAVLVVLMYVSMGHTMWGAPLPTFLTSDPLRIGLVQLVLSAVVLVINRRFFVSGVKGVFRGAPNMDTLVALGAAASFGYSVAVLCTASAGMLHDLYFETAAMIPALITVGKTLEARSKGRTTTALRELLKLAPKTATVVRDGEEIIVPVEQVQVGDVFVVRPGDTVAVDGEVIDGHSAVNESALTGESIPVDKAVGDTVSAATLNQSGFLTCRATRVGEDTTLAQIVRMVSDAAAGKAPIAKLADTVAGVFVPIVMGIAVITAVIWLLTGATVGFAVARGVAVLVISCPCALGLATPVAIMVGNGVGAKHGILFKTAAALEHTGKADVVVLDKTGTITAGLPQVTAVMPSDTVTENELLTVAASLEKQSEHPLARAVLEEAERRGLTLFPVTEFRALHGNGVTATADGQLYGGSVAYIDTVVPVSDDWKSRAAVAAEAGQTPLLFVRDEHVLGLIAVADVIKSDSAEAIGELRHMGLRVVMLTGDNERTARAIGEQVGVDEVIAGVLPDGKEAAIRALQQHGRVVMVGDGINDAPALTRADIGMAIGAGTDVAIDAADVVLMNDRISDVAAAIRLGRATLRNIKQNLFWAFLYNSLGIPLAAGAFIPLFAWEMNPMIGALAMSLSSVCVVSNALRLNRVRLYPNAPKRITKTMVIEGMMCEHCEAAVKKALEAVAGVVSAEANHTKGVAVVTLHTEVDNDVLRKAVEAEEYEVKGIK